LIHCVGSREIEGVDEPHEDGQVNNYCSRVCCTATLHAAEELRQRFPALNIYELYQDIRTYGRGHEEHYRGALEGGVRFVRYNGEERPQVIPAPKGDTHPVLIHVKDSLTYNEELEIPVDLVVLAVGMEPRQIDALVKMLKVSRGNDSRAHAGAFEGTEARSTGNLQGAARHAQNDSRHRGGNRVARQRSAVVCGVLQKIRLDCRKGHVRRLSALHQSGGD